jgi:hypothetical protein
MRVVRSSHCRPTLVPDDSDSRPATLVPGGQSLLGRPDECRVGVLEGGQQAIAIGTSDGRSRSPGRRHARPASFASCREVTCHDDPEADSRGRPALSCVGRGARKRQRTRSACVRRGRAGRGDAACARCSRSRLRATRERDASAAWRGRGSVIDAGARASNGYRTRSHAAFSAGIVVPCPELASESRFDAALQTSAPRWRFRGAEAAGMSSPAFTSGPRVAWSAGQSCDTKALRASSSTRRAVGMYPARGPEGRGDALPSRDRGAGSLQHALEQPVQQLSGDGVGEQVEGVAGSVLPHAPWRLDRRRLLGVGRLLHAYVAAGNHAGHPTRPGGRQAPAGGCG